MIRDLRFLVCLTFIFLSSCEVSRWETDTSGIEFDAEFFRLDREVFSLVNSAELDSLIKANPLVVKPYLSEIMQLGPDYTAMTFPLLQQFSNERVWKELQELIETQYPDLNAQGEQLGRAFKRFAVFFSTDSLPQLVAYNSGYNIGVYPTSSWLGIGLEWYIGADNEVVKRLPGDLFPQYKRDKMNPQYLVPNALKGWLFVRFQDELRNDELIDRIIFNGKVLYLTEVLLERVPIDVILNYDKAELAFCDQSEFAIWKHLLENDLLFTRDTKRINQLLGDGPFTPGMPLQSPGGVANWVGYRMVKSYMESHQEITLPQLMKMSDHRPFLNAYKPV